MHKKHQRLLIMALIGIIGIVALYSFFSRGKGGMPMSLPTQNTRSANISGGDMEMLDDDLHVSSGGHDIELL